MQSLWVRLWNFQDGSYSSGKSNTRSGQVTLHIHSSLSTVLSPMVLNPRNLAAFGDGLADLEQSNRLISSAFYYLDPGLDHRRRGSVEESLATEGFCFATPPIGKLAECKYKSHLFPEYCWVWIEMQSNDASALVGNLLDEDLEDGKAGGVLQQGPSGALPA